MTAPSPANTVDDDGGSTAIMTTLWHEAAERLSRCGWSTVPAIGLACAVGTGCSGRGGADPDRSSPQWAPPNTHKMSTVVMAAIAITDRDRGTRPAWRRRTTLRCGGPVRFG
ncbi:hypothetical protein H7J54_08235 [Mycolicibacter arupensis]|uniref:hypothetical protein n=1 Tax=Mycolicibacter arupensis TaxID=342002 RepID=UPI000A918BF2|nr:hypothetical protein [Mycolicibacter arupensis]MCV7275597.1 hypothetical protein [Mycolicibacter arupensis]